jgi:hypothetical protein
MDSCCAIQVESTAAAEARWAREARTAGQSESYPRVSVSVTREAGLPQRDASYTNGTAADRHSRRRKRRQAWFTKASSFQDEWHKKSSSQVRRMVSGRREAGAGAVAGAGAGAGRDIELGHGLVPVFAQTIGRHQGESRGATSVQRGEHEQEQPVGAVQTALGAVSATAGVVQSVASSAHGMLRSMFGGSATHEPPSAAPTWGPAPAPTPTRAPASPDELVVGHRSPTAIC